MAKRYSLFIILIVLASLNVFSQVSIHSKKSANQRALKLAIIGLSHSHVHGLLGRPDKGDIEIVGIVESNAELVKRLQEQYKFSPNLVYVDIESMIKATSPEAVAAFNSIKNHLEVVELCAPKGIHVMVEKPLAANLADAKIMEELAKKHRIELLTNYETTWYASNHESYKIAVSDQQLGRLRKVVIHDGHEGPKEIGVNQEFLDWLTDPIENGGGAIIDFGCYGANLLTWLHKGQRPLSVSGTLQQFKPHVYPKVDDEATVVVSYSDSQGIIQASWNWPFSRKDMEVYGEKGYLMADNANTLRARIGTNQESKVDLNPRLAPYDDPFSLFAAVVKKQIRLDPYDLSSLENNMIVMEILDAAIRSHKTGTTIYLDQKK